MKYTLEIQDATPFLDAAKLALFVATLPPARASRILAPAKGKDRALRAAAEHALIRAARRLHVPYAAMEITYTPMGKPYVTNMPRVAVNFSHSGLIGVTLLAVSDEGEDPLTVGVDVEECNPRDSEERLVERYFSPEEQKVYREANDKTAAFFALWTRMEASAKMTGVGLGQWLVGKPQLPEAFAHTWRTTDTRGAAYLVSCVANVNIFPTQQVFDNISLANLPAICYNQYTEN